MAVIRRAGFGSVFEVENEKVGIGTTGSANNTLQALGRVKSSDAKVIGVSTISTYQALTSTQLENFYTSLAQLLTPNSFTFDDSGSGFIYNGYPGKNRNWPSPNKPTNFVPDSAGHENQWFLA